MASLIDHGEGLSDELAGRLASLPPAAVAALVAALDEPENPFTPLPGPQSAAYESPADELLYGGAAGGSKSYLLLGLAATRHRRSLILRRQSTELDGLVADLTQMLGAAGYNKNEHEHTSGGRSIKLGGCREPEDWRAYAGRARDLLAFDEAGEFLEDQVASLLAWLRSVEPNQRCRLVLASNPPRSADGEWLIRWFAPWLDPSFGVSIDRIDADSGGMHVKAVPDHLGPANPGELRWFVRVNGETRWVAGPGHYQIDGERYTARSRTFIPARLSDNPYLDRSEYRAGLENLPEPLRSQLLKGDFLAGRADDAWQLIPSDWVAAAQARWEPGIPGPMTAIGVDVAQGGVDMTILAPRHGKWYAPLKAFRGIDTKDGPAVAGLVFATMRDACDIAVDMGGGWGGSAYDHLRHQLPHVQGIVPAAASMLRTRDMKLGFVNKRAEIHWKFREALDPVTGDGIALPPDPALSADLCAVRWKYTARGIQVELKPEIVKRLGRSPDRGDAVIISWAVGADREPERVEIGALQTQANVGYAKFKAQFGSMKRHQVDVRRQARASGLRR